MTIFIEYDTTGKVIFQHHMPFDIKYGLGKTEEELLQTGKLVELPEKLIDTEGKRQVLYYNLVTQECFYRYGDIEISEEQTQLEKIRQLENALSETTLLLAEQNKKMIQNEQAILELTQLVGGIQ